MEVYKNLVIVGTSHIARQSLNDVEKVILEKKPDVVALELDKERLYALLNKDNVDRRAKWGDIRRIGIKGYIFARLVEWIENKLGEKVGVKPGEDMLKAVMIAKEHKIKVALIDQRIEVTLKNLNKYITWKERGRFFIDVLKAVFGFGEKINFDLNKVPDDKLIEKMLLKVKDRYPSLYNVLVVDRNKYMAIRLKKLMNNFDLIVAIVGAGHVEDLIEEVKLLEM
ncbi:MAG TPA: TraB/GumN family protein [Candidatus Nanoarchaeia archaeon]|nr:TraB/GumN family protein [Candidatus Nanoarchaeia archaeon]